MDLDHGTMVWLSKSFGLFYLIALSVAVLVYACWPANRKRFEEAGSSILSGEDKPWR
ncbi:MAG TPA: cbb3-type cytochrome c oxidase subunit 3 [Xanthobacteraceae bacterium]|nr:cbb3-type cytochrome c oxidase subunit 3 [Xanthobacteraceae bacterium]